MARICPGQRGYSSSTEILLKQPCISSFPPQQSISMRDGNMACNRLALCLHSGIEAFSLTHLLWALWYFCPRSTISIGVQLTRLLAGFSLFFWKTPCTLTHCRSLVIFFPDNQTAVCLLPTYMSWEIENSLRLFNPSLAQFKRTYNLQEGVLEFLPPCPDTSYMNQSRMTRMHTKPNITRNKVYKNLVCGIGSLNLVPPLLGPAQPFATSWRLWLLYPAVVNLDGLEISFWSHSQEESLGARKGIRVAELC